MGRDPEPLAKNLRPPSRIEPMMPVGKSDTPREAFPSLMQQGAKQSATAPATSPFELARNQAALLLSRSPTLGSVQTQLLHAQSSLGDMASSLQTPNLKIKPSTKYLLRNKLGDAVTQLHVVHRKLGGTNDPEEEDSPGGKGVVEYFLGLVNEGQRSIAGANRQLQKLASDKDGINPAEMLFVQVKMNKAQQLLDFATVLVGKAVDDLKQLFNITL